MVKLRHSASGQASSRPDASRSVLPPGSISVRLPGPISLKSTGRAIARLLSPRLLPRNCASRLMSRLMLMMDAHPHLRQRALRILAVEPSLFSRLLNVNVGELAVSEFGVSHTLRLGWRLLTPGWEL